MDQFEAREKARAMFGVWAFTGIDADGPFVEIREPMPTQGWGCAAASFKAGELAPDRAGGATFPEALEKLARERAAHARGR